MPPAPPRGSSALSPAVIDDLYDFALTVTWDPVAAEEAVQRGLRRSDPQTATTPDFFRAVREVAVARARPPDTAVVDVNEELPAPADLPVPMVESIALAVLDGLDPSDRATLDLALRRGLAGDELAMALDVPAGDADAAVRDARGRADDCLGHYVLARIGHDTCPRLREALGDPPPDRLVPLAARVEAHLEECTLCTDRRLGLTPVTALLETIPSRPAPEALHEALGHLWEKEDLEAEEAVRRRRRLAVLMGALAVVVAAGVLIALDVVGGGGDKVEETATTLAPVLSAETTTVDFGRDDSSGTAVVRNLADRRVRYRVEVDVPWLTVSPTEGEIAAGDTTELALALDRAAAPEGEIVTTMRVVSAGTTTEVDVAAEIPRGPEVGGVSVDPPQVAVAGCEQAPTTGTVSAAVTTVADLDSVVLHTSQGDVPLEARDGSWAGTLGPYPAEGVVTFTVVATDAGGKSASSPELTLTVTACPAG